MNKEQLLARIQELQNAIDQSAANHNALLGRLIEAKEMLAHMEKMETLVETENAIS